LFFFAACGEKKFITLQAAREKKSVVRRGLFIIEPRSIYYRPGSHCMKAMDMNQTKSETSPVHNGKNKTNDTPYWILTYVLN
jgi:hypothetical protein